MKASVRVPATVANLGCGFDTLGLALPIYNTITIQETVMPGSGIEINVINKLSNETINVPTDKNSIVYKAIEILYNFIGQIPSELKIDIETNIPIARGLGSSSSVIVGSLLAANELLSRPADRSVLISIASELEGHPDNIVPAMLGGVTLSSLEEDGSVIAKKLPWPDEWMTTICIPDYELSTEISRSVLPEMVNMKDAIHNLRCSAMFVNAIYTQDENLLKMSLKDKLHQPYRTKLVPGLTSIFENLKHTNGVLGCVLAGAGPSILIISKKEALEEINEIVKKTWNEINVNSTILTLPIENIGAKVL